MKPKKLYLGCTVAQNLRIGVNAVVNARGGQQWRNEKTIADHNMERDARNLRAWLTGRVSVHQFNSRTFRNRPELQKHLSDYPR